MRATAYKIFPSNHVGGCRNFMLIAIPHSLCMELSCIIALSVIVKAITTLSLRENENPRKQEVTTKRRTNRTSELSLQNVQT